MNDRLTKLEAFSEGFQRSLDGLTARTDRLEALLLATKDDVNNAVKWIVGIMLAISMAAITIITFVLNNATPKVVPAAQPIVIYAAELPHTRPAPSLQ
ncbi:MAG TPA: hypothetical protein VFT37_15900 [Telluria sp.]|nr:hypothetical protein [Telluria sp.]